MIKIATDFSPVPSGRYRTDGPDSGERFREEFLIPALEGGGKLIVDIDGTEGYQTSFLEEAFGGLIWNKVIDKADLLNRLEIINKDPDYAIYRDLIWTFIKDAPTAK